MAQITHTLMFNTEDGMIEFGQALSVILGAGKTIALKGQVGAGKSTLARAIIQTLLPVAEDIPSPTFTIVQTYDAGAFEIWHSDLYRLNTLDQIDELGLWEAFEHAACLIEWPEVLGDHLPTTAMTLDIRVTDDEGRVITVTAPDDQWPNLKDVMHATQRTDQ